MKNRFDPAVRKAIKELLGKIRPYIFSNTPKKKSHKLPFYEKNLFWGSISLSVALSGGSGAGAAGGRGVPDVAGNADPTTGYQIYSGGQAQVVGGTSAVAPLWAALISRLAQATGQRYGLLQPTLYAGVTPGTDAPGFRDITSGNNGAYAAGPGWDACTGLGSPDGTALLKRLQG